MGHLGGSVVKRLRRRLLLPLPLPLLVFPLSLAVSISVKYINKIFKKNQSIIDVLVCI